MSGKAIRRDILEFTQKIQVLFPDINSDTINAWNKCPKEKIEKYLLDMFSKKPESVVFQNFLIKLVGKVDIPATTEKFIAKDHFVVDTSKKAKVKFSWFGDNFEKWFFGKEEEPMAAKTLQYWELVKNSVDTPIIAELGGEAKAETTLACLCYLLEQQRDGEKGVLLVNGRANIFYIRDVDGALRAVLAYWSGDGWDVHALSIGDPRSWLAGYQVFSSNS